MSREHINRVVRWHIGVVIAVLLVFTVGAVLMSTSPRSGLEKVHTVSDLENIPVVISYAAGDVIGARSTTDQLADYQKYHDQNVDIACHAQVVMIVTAQQEIELTTVSIGQKVRINNSNGNRFEKGRIPDPETEKKRIAAIRATAWNDRKRIIHGLPPKTKWRFSIGVYDKYKKEDE